MLVLSLEETGTVLHSTYQRLFPSRAACYGAVERRNSAHVSFGRGTPKVELGNNRVSSEYFEAHPGFSREKSAAVDCATFTFSLFALCADYTAFRALL